MAFLAHILHIFAGVLGPLVILISRQESRFVKFHAIQSIAWQICLIVFSFGGFFLVIVGAFATGFLAERLHGGNNELPGVFMFVPFVWLLGMGLWLTNLILGILVGMKANRGEWAEYPIIGAIVRKRFL